MITMNLYYCFADRMSIVLGKYFYWLYMINMILTMSQISNIIKTYNFSMK